MLLAKVLINLMKLTKVVKILPQKFQKFLEPILQKLLYMLVKLFKAENMLKNSWKDMLLLKDMELELVVVEEWTKKLIKY